MGEEWNVAARVYVRMETPRRKRRGYGGERKAKERCASLGRVFARLFGEIDRDAGFVERMAERSDVLPGELL